MIAKYMLVDYYIENWVLIIETNQMGVFDLPKQTLNAIIHSFSLYFCAKLERLFILNPSWGLKTIWSIISSFMDPETNEKIQMIPNKLLKNLKTYIPDDSLLTQYGGQVQLPTNNIWPPKDIFSKANEMMLAKLGLDQHDQNKLLLDQKGQKLLPNDQENLKFWPDNEENYIVEEEMNIQPIKTTIYDIRK